MFRLIHEQQQRGGGRRRRYKRRRRRQTGGGGGLKRAIARGKILMKDPRWQAHLRSFANYLEEKGDRRSKYVRMMIDGSRYAARFHKRYIATPQYR